MQRRLRYVDCYCVTCFYPRVRSEVLWTKCFFEYEIIVSGRTHPICTRGNLVGGTCSRMFRSKRTMPVMILFYRPISGKGSEKSEDILT